MDLALLRTVHRVVVNADAVRTIADLDLKAISRELGEIVGREVDLEVLSTTSGADASLNLHLTRFDQLQGSAIGAERPAAVAFTLALRRVGDRSPTWSADYFLQDAAVTDNLLALGERRRAGFSTASQLLSDGLLRAARELQRDRTEAFVATPSR